MENLNTILTSIGGVWFPIEWGLIIAFYETEAKLESIRLEIKCHHATDPDRLSLGFLKRTVELELAEVRKGNAKRMIGWSLFLWSECGLILPFFLPTFLLRFF